MVSPISYFKPEGEDDMNATEMLEIRDGQDVRPKYEGKAKRIYETKDPNVYRMVFKDDITAGDGEKKDTLLNKGKLNQTISKKIFEHLHTMQIGRDGSTIQTHYLSSPSVNEQLVKKLTIIPIEVIIRNYAAGSFCRRYGVKSGQKFSTPLLELFYKNDDLHDPLCGEQVALEMGWCDASQLHTIKEQAHILNLHMTHFWARYQLTLVDQKFEFGVDAEGNIMLADEITCDSQRLWDKEGKSLDKDVFRKGDNMQDVSDVYNYVHTLIGADPIVEEQMGC